MKIINERYHIVKKISETLNSINYLVNDVYTKKRCLLKLLNRNVKHPFPLEYFKKEYVINSSLKHVLIRNPLTFEMCVSIDGNTLAEPEYFFCTPFYENPFPIDKETITQKVTVEIIDVLTYLHENNCFHGDIRKENFFLFNDTLVFFDISPFIPYSIGRQDDIKKIISFLKPMTTLSVKRATEDIREVIRESDTISRHLSIADENAKAFTPPMLVVFPEIAVTLRDVIYSEKTMLNVHANDVRNARFWSNSCIPEYEVVGFRALQIEHADPFEPFSIFRTLYLYADVFEKTKSLLHEYAREFCKVVPISGIVPTAVLGSPAEEDAKLTRLIVHTIETLADIHPIVIVIPDWSQLDPQSRKLCSELADVSPKKIKLLAASDENLEWDNASNFECPSLRRDDVARVLRTIYYYYPVHEQLVDKIFTVTGGDLAMISDGLEKAALSGDTFIENNAVSFKHPAEYYFDAVGVFEKSLTATSTDIINVLHAMSYFDGRIGNDIVEQLPECQRKFFDQAVVERFLVKNTTNYHFRYSFYIRHIPKSFPNPVCDTLATILSTMLYDEAYLMVPLMRILFATEQYDRFLSALDELFVLREEKPKYNDISRYAWECFIEAEKVVDKVTRSHVFFVYENVLWLNGRRGKYDSAMLLEKMKMYRESEEEQVRYLTALFGEGKPTQDEYAAAIPTYEKSTSLRFMVRWRLLTAYLARLGEEGLFEKEIEVFEHFILPRLGELPPRLRFDACNNAEVTYSRLRIVDKAEHYLHMMQKIAEDYPDQINDNQIFTLYNNYFVYLRQESKDEEAFVYAYKAIAVAKKSHDYRKLALIHNNIGAGLFWTNQRIKAHENYVLCLEYSYKAKIADYVLLGTRNIVDYYCTVHEFTKAYEDFNKGFASYERANFIMQKSNILKIGAWMLYEIGAWKDGDEYLHQVRALLEGHTYSLAEEFQYFAIEAMHLYHTKGRETAIAFLRNVPEREKLMSSPKSLILLYLYVLHYLYLKNDKEYVKELLLYIQEHTHEIPNASNYNFTALIILLRIWTGLDKFRDDCVCLGLIEESNLIILFCYLYCSHHNKDAVMWYEHFYHAARLLHYAYSTVPEKYRADFRISAPLYTTYEPFLAEHGQTIAVFSAEKFPKCCLKKGSDHIRHKRTDFFKHATFSNLTDTTQMLQRSITDALAVSGFERGIYFEYDKTRGWIKKNEVFNPVWYREDEAYNEALVTDVLREQEDKLLFYKQKRTDGRLSITEAICFPVIDITMARDRNMKKSSSSTSLFHLLSLKGAFYFDTKHALVQPDREDVYHLFFLRELINLGIYHNKLKQDMLLDPLTGLYKRETWFDMAKNLLNVAADQNKHLTIMMTDIDFFKAVNDVYGHKTGDLVLQKVAQSALESLRVIDIGGRYGGEEFIYCLVETAGDSAMKAAERLRLAVQHASILTDKQVTLSAGLACFPFDGTLLSDLIEKADKALLAAKEAGRNRCMTWKECAAFADKVERHVLPVISNPSREKDKIDCVIELIDAVSLLNGAESMVDELRNVCARYLEIEELLFVVFCDGEKKVYPRQLASMVTEEFLSESLDEQTQLFAARPGKGCEYGLYFQAKPGSQKPLLEKRFYRFVAGVVLERLMAASLIVSVDE